MTVTVFERARVVDPSRGIDETGTVIVESISRVVPPNMISRKRE